MKFISETDQLRETNKPTMVFVSSAGYEIKEENNAAAKQMIMSSVSKFFVRSSKRQRRLFNPIVDKIDQKSVLRTELEFEFQEVNKDCYDSYLEYLKTRNSYMLTKADLFAKR